MIFTIKLVEKTIQIHSLYDNVYNYCMDYLVENVEFPDLIIHVSEKELDQERELLAKEEKKPGGRSTTTNYSSGVIETYLVHRKIADGLLVYNAFVFHGAVLCIRDTEAEYDFAYIFTGKSGIGKTTHVNLWLKEIPNAYILNGDKPFISIKDDGIYVYGSPWQGKERIGINGCAKLKSICLIKRAENNSIKKREYSDFYIELLRQTHRPKDIHLLNKTIDLLEKINCSFYTLECNNFKEDVLDVSTTIL